MILAIDPGNIESGYVIINDGYEPIEVGKVLNDEVLDLLDFTKCYTNRVVIEMVASYGMAVGQTVFDTCVWIGRFYQKAIEQKLDVSLVFRKDVKMNLCGQTRAKDSNIKQALVDRFSYDRHKAKGGKGVKTDKGWFFGFKADIWQAYALGVTYLDREVK